MYRKLNITFKFSHQTSETSTWFLWVIVQSIDFAVFHMNEKEKNDKSFWNNKQRGGVVVAYRRIF